MEKKMNHIIHETKSSSEFRGRVDSVSGNFFVGPIKENAAFEALTRSFAGDGSCSLRRQESQSKRGVSDHV